MSPLPPPGEPAASGAGVVEELKEANPHKVRNAGEFAKVGKSQLSLRKFDVMPR